MIKGEPFVLEKSLSGQIQCRPYDARIKCSRSGTILVRPINITLTPTESKAALEYVKTITSSYTLPEPFFILQEFISLLVTPSTNCSVDTVNNFYSKILEERDSFSRQSKVTMKDLSTQGLPRHTAFVLNSTTINSNSSFRKSKDVYVRDKLL
jgi:hypothetical protein